MTLGSMARLQSLLLAKSKPKTNLAAHVKRVARNVASANCDAIVAWASCSSIAVVAAMQIAGWLK